jgi:pimeloyl-ACP methyl ester carboxylesterase
VSRSFLHTIRTGAPDGAPFLILHDRFEVMESAEALGELLGDEATKIAIRSPRAQSAGGSGITKGYFWYIGPLDQPELSTLGDGLYQLELLIEETFERYGQRKIGLLGAGEGGFVALIAASFFPDKVQRVVAIDATLPQNLKDMPFEPSLAGVETVLAYRDMPSADRLAQLEQLGASVTLVPEPELAAFLQS